MAASVRFRARTLDLVEHRWIAITVTSLVSHLSLYLVLLVTLRDVGVSEAEVGWPRSWRCSRSPGWPPPSR